MGNTADIVFLRRILYAMIGLTMATCILATVTAVEAMDANAQPVYVIAKK